MDFASYKKLKELYKTAIANAEDTISFNGYTLLVDYTKYLIEHLDYVFGNRDEVIRKTSV
jgi:hypothetical protein